MRSELLGVLGVLLVAGCAQEHQYLTYEAAEQICIAMSACLSLEDFAEAPGGCALGRVGDPANEPGVYRCVLAAGADCDAVRACLGIRSVSVDHCDGAMPHCEGDTLVLCQSGGFGERSRIVRRRCGADRLPDGALGLSRLSGVAPATLCVESEVTGPRCVVGRCDLEGGRCVSPNRYDECAGGLVTTRADCAPGFACRESGGSAFCAPLEGDACTAATCDATGRFHVCWDDGSGPGLGRLGPADAVIDCADLGLRCDPRQSCVPPSDACDPSTDAPTCVGEDLLYCGADGQLRTYDCAAHGWGGCGAPRGIGVCIPLSSAPP